jgi:uncharacterized membrane protein
MLPHMGQLVFSVFTAEESAMQVLRELRTCDAAPESVASAGTVSVLPGGSYAVGTTDRPGSSSGFSGVFWEALFGLVFLVHVPGSSYGPNAGALFETISRAGVDEGFRARVREALTPGTSAIGLLLKDEDAESVVALLEPYGAAIVGTSLSPEQDAELGRELGRTP